MDGRPRTPRRPPPAASAPAGESLWLGLRTILVGRDPDGSPADRRVGASLGSTCWIAAPAGLSSVARGGGYAFLSVPGRDYRQLPLLIAAAIAAASAQRLSAVYSVVWIAYVPAALTGTRPVEIIERIWSRRRLAVTGFALIVGALGTALFVYNRAWALRVPTVRTFSTGFAYPAGAVDYLVSTGFRGNLMTSFGSGSYVMWHLYPEVFVGMDSRYGVAYPPEAAIEICRLYQAELDWNRLLRSYGADAILVPSGEALHAAMAESGGHGWIEVYDDDGFAIFSTAEVAASLPIVDRSGDEIGARFP
jgi:hypothetical protein